VTFGPAGIIAAGYSRSVSILGKASFSGVVVLLDAEGERLRTKPIEVKEGRVLSVAFDPAGTVAAGYSRGSPLRFSDGGVVMLDGNPASGRAKLGQVANRNLTWQEWKQFFPNPDMPYRRTIRSFPWPHDLRDAERKKAEAWEKEHPVARDAS
jgi:hypothetical protein